MNPTVLIGLDGATFTILDSLMENGDMPFLREFVRTGVRAQLLSTVNPLTPPAWISMITGRSPGNHGVFDFIWAEEREKDHYFTLYNFRDIQCETVWSMVGRHGGRICSLNFPMMSPPPEVPGCIIPGLISWKHLRRNIHPRELHERIKGLPGYNARELAWDFDLEKKAEKGIHAGEYESWVEFHIRREKQWFEITRYLMKNEPCDLTAILFDGTDKISHMGWRFIDPGQFSENPSAWEKKMRELCLDYFRELDRFMAEIVTLSGPDARVFMASDHGFGPTRTVFRVNSWLHEQGYLTWRDPDELDEKDREGARKLAENHFVFLDWDRTTAYARTTTSNGIYIRVAKEPGRSGIAPDRYESFRAELMDKLRAVIDPATGEPMIRRVLTKEEAYPGENNAQAPDILLIMRDYHFASILNREPIIEQRPEVEGTHHPEGIFIARGPGIGKGLTLRPLSIMDVTPALLYSLGIPIPSDIEAALPVEAFETEYLHEHPRRVGDPTQRPETFSLQAGRYAIESEEEEQIYKQMKALGYME